MDEKKAMEEKGKALVNFTGDTAVDVTVDPPQLFCQMDVLYHFIDGDMEWRETARWIKYEERVEVGERWSKPYVATLSLHALFEFRSCISDGVVILDTKRTELQPVYEEVAEELAQASNLSTESKQKVLYLLLRPHKHQHRKGLNKKPFQGKLAFMNDPDLMNDSNMSLNQGSAESLNTPNDPEEKSTRFPFPKLPKDGSIPTPLKKKFKPNKKFSRKVAKDAEATNILIGEVDFLSHPIMAFVRLQEPSVLGHVTEVKIPTRFMFILLGPPDHHSIWEYEEVGRAAASLLTDKVFCEVAHMANGREALLSGIDEYIDDLTVLPPSIWDPTTRLEPPSNAADPNSTLRARRRIASRERHVTLPQVVEEDEEEEEEEIVKEDSSLIRTGKLFGGMVADVKRRYRLYLSDIKDALAVQSIASIVFLYFACFTPIITFGGLLGIATNGYMGTMETIMSGALCGLVYHLFAGQPLTIMGATGPLLVFESLVYKVCLQYNLEFMPFRFWIGMWAALMLLFVVAFDLSAWVRYITRFTEESFSVLISLIFIYEAFSKQFKTLKYNPVHIKTIHEVNQTCHCIPQACEGNYTDTCLGVDDTAPNPLHSWTSGLNISKDCVNVFNEAIIRYDCITEKQCIKYGGTLVGSACYEAHITRGVPDVFFVSLFLFLGTFGVAWVLARFRNGSLFPSIVRSTLADFAVVIAVLIATGVDLYLGIDTPKLPVPDEVKTTRPERGWVINPVAFSNWWIILLAIVPALLVTILIFLDQQITAVIVNRKEHKLKKGHGYHLDLFMVAVLVAVCSALGLPWFVAATVRTITHVRSLMKQSETAAPGEVPVFLGVREQRVTGIVIHILIGVSVLATSVLKKIPMSVLYGVFLYMGVSSLRGVEFVQRITLLFMPQKYQPDYVYLRHVRTLRVHVFTIVQIVCMAAMWVVKMIDTIAIAFPMVILGLCLVRKIMGCVFTDWELQWLDDLSPEQTRRRKEDKMKEELAGEHLTDYNMETFDVRKDSIISVGAKEPHMLVHEASVHSVNVTMARVASWRKFSGSDEGMVPSVEIPKVKSMKELKEAADQQREAQMTKPVSMNEMTNLTPRHTPNGMPSSNSANELGTGPTDTHCNGGSIPKVLFNVSGDSPAHSQESLHELPTQNDINTDSITHMTKI